jgi:hypothetical protein
MRKLDVIRLIGKKNWIPFNAWMKGQTVSMNNDGSLDYYAWDVMRYKSMMQVRK